LTLVPIRLYTDRSLIKLEFAVARGKKRFDKRHAIRERELKRRLLSVSRRGSEKVRS
jgi:SsrA-binding protein